MTPNTLLALMLLSYFAPIAYIYYISSSISNNGADAAPRSISSIITSKEPFTTAFSCADVFQTRHFIAACMFLMAIFTILYEYQRCLKSRIWSLAFIIVILVGIFGVIYVAEDDPHHYLFAAAVFLAILGFMVGHTYYAEYADADTLRIILYAQFLFMIITVISVLQDAPIFAVEVLFLMNFAVFYLYIHTCSSCDGCLCSNSPPPIADAGS